MKRNHYKKALEEGSYQVSYIILEDSLQEKKDIIKKDWDNESSILIDLLNKIQKKEISMTGEYFTINSFCKSIPSKSRKEIEAYTTYLSGERMRLLELSFIFMTSSNDFIEVCPKEIMKSIDNYKFINPETGDEVPNFMDRTFMVFKPSEELLAAIK